MSSTRDQVNMPSGYISKTSLHSSKTVVGLLWHEMLETLNLFLSLHKPQQHLLLKKYKLLIAKWYKAGIEISVTLRHCC